MSYVKYSNGTQIQYTYDQLGNRLTKSRTILLPLAAGSITGTSTVCKGDDSVAYSVPVIQNAGWYIWTLPAGATIISGDSTRSILVNFSAAAQSGSLSVYGKNEGGQGAVSPLYAVMVNSKPGVAGVISGAAQVLAGQSGVNYTVPPVTGATGYVWSLPTGASITAGENTASITVAYSTSAVSGSVTVKAINGCGEGTSSPVFAVVVSSGVPVLQSVQSVTLTSGQIMCYNATQTITVAGSGTNFTVQNGGRASMIAGQNIRFLAGTSVQQGGYLHGYISANGPWCSMTKSGEMAVLEEGSSMSPIPTASNVFVKVYPNPTTGELHIVLNEIQPCENYRLFVLDLFGKTVKSIEFSELSARVVSLENLPSGLYFLRVICGSRTQVVKVIRN